MLATELGPHHRRRPRIETVGVRIETQEAWKADLIKAVRTLVHRGVGRSQMLFSFVIDNGRQGADLEIPKEMASRVRTMIENFLSGHSIVNYVVKDGPVLSVVRAEPSIPVQAPPDASGSRHVFSVAAEERVDPWEDLGYRRK